MSRDPTLIIPTPVVAVTSQSAIQIRAFPGEVLLIEQGENADGKSSATLFVNGIHNLDCLIESLTRVRKGLAGGEAFWIDVDEETARAQE